VLVSDMPGTTRDAIDTVLTWHRRRFRIVDTAGMRRPGRVGKGGKVEVVSVAQAKKAIVEADVVVLVIDAGAGATDHDAAIGGEADRAGRGIVLLANKWDLVKDRGPDYSKIFDDETRRRRVPFLWVVGEAGERLPHDGQSAGVLYVRGPWIASAYFRDEQATREAFDAEGWFSTGDVATIDPQGYMQITDRAKDLVRSGGEWISSIDLENLAVGHPDLAEAAVIAVPHPRWGERPLLVAVRRPGAEVGKAAILEYLTGKVASWWLPDDVVFVEELPHTATGKLQKTALRERFKDHVLPTA